MRGNGVFACAQSNRIRSSQQDCNNLPSPTIRRLARGSHLAIFASVPPALVVALFLTILWVAAAVIVTRGNRRMIRLAELSSSGPTLWPRVSIVLAARNEGATIGAALPTVLALDYPDFELIAVDDRSEDDTGAILDRLAAANPKLQVDHIRELPAGWLGKNHALHHGAQRATGKWILFTDADVHFTPGSLRRAVVHAGSDRSIFLPSCRSCTSTGRCWAGA